MQATDDNSIQWTCPNCNATLNTSPEKHSSLTCNNGHSFDLAQQGYVNLLLDNQKNSKHPGDNKEMLNARRRFLSAGYYSPLVEFIQKHLKDNDKIIDLGCGEGYYIGCLLNNKPTMEAVGIDIAKIGIQKASTQYKGHQLKFAVANTFKIPLASHSVTTILSIFAPFCPEEAQRILTAEGVLIRVSPAALHLQEIKAKLYVNSTEHSKIEVPFGFDVIKNQRLTWTTTLSGKVLTKDLIPMTPLHWQGSNQVKHEIEQQDLEVTFDFNIEVLKIKADTKQLKPE